MGFPWTASALQKQQLLVKNLTAPLRHLDNFDSGGEKRPWSLELPGGQLAHKLRSDRQCAPIRTEYSGGRS